MPCPIDVGSNVCLVNNPGQTGVVIRNNSLGTHSHVIQMTSNSDYPNGKKMVFYGNNGCSKWETY